MKKDMRNRSSTLALFGVGVAIVIGCLFAGYYWPSLHKGSSPSTASLPVARSMTPAPVVAPTPAPAPPKRLDTTATDYTAPGAPDIEIAEVKDMVIPRKATTDNTDTPVDTTQPDTSDTTTQPDNTDTSNTPATQPTDNGSTAGTDTTTPADNTNPGDAGSADNGAAATTDQPGDNTAEQTPTGPAGPIYRVQAGSFINEANARILASALRRRGYTAVAVPGTEDGKPVFKVQVGAYHSKALADEAATDLQKTGYPAYVSH